MQNFKYYLCGGTLFSLIYEFRRNPYTQKEKWQGHQSKITSDNMLIDLIKLIDPKYSEISKSSRDRYTSEFKHCKNNYPDAIPFLQESFINKFESRMDNYPALINDTINYIERYLCYENDDSIEELGQLILDLIINDTEIDNEELIYLDSGTSGISKKNLLKETKFNLPCLIIGALYNICTRNKNNLAGQESINSWYQKTTEYRPGIFILKPTDRYKNIKIKIEKFNIIKSKESVYEKYYKNACNDIEQIKTLTCFGKPESFYNIYVNPNIINDKNVEIKGESLSTLKYIKSTNRFTSIVAIAGQGKSMFLKHLFLSDKKLEGNKYFEQSNLIPIYIEVRSYSLEKESLENIIYDNVIQYSDEISKSKLFKDLKVGNFLLLFDGIDEINENELINFSNELNRFINIYPNNYYVTSSRPNSGTEALRRFTEIKLCGFDVQKARRLIYKIPNYNKTIKEKFCNDYLLRPFHLYASLTTNPLLLNLMFLVYVQNGTLPDQQYKFYDEAYNTLFERHDKLKGFKRTYKIPLTKQEYKEFIAAFCFYTITIQMYEFDTQDIEKIFNDLNIIEKIDIDSFLYDLSENLNIINKEKGKYKFIHKSFQEYFAAYEINMTSGEKYQNLAYLIMSLEKENYNQSLLMQDDRIFFHSGKSDNILYFLKDMNKEKFSEFIIKPYLEKIIPKEDSIKSFLFFLKSITTLLDIGPQTFPFIENGLFALVNNIAFGDMKHEPDIINFPELDEYTDECLWAVENDQFSSSNLENSYLMSDVDIAQELNKFKTDDEKNEWLNKHNIDLSNPDFKNYCIPTQEMYDHPENFKELINYLFNDNHRLKKKYIELRNFLNY